VCRTLAVESFARIFTAGFTGRLARDVFAVGRVRRLLFDRACVSQL
jgi:hypothetical protein